MKPTIIALLWIFGMFVDIIWTVGDKDKMKELQDRLSDSGVTDLFSNKVIYTVLIIVCVIGSVFWPYDIYWYTKKLLKHEST